MEKRSTPQSSLERLDGSMMVSSKVTPRAVQQLIERSG
jgi:hypothetical protein